MNSLLSRMPNRYARPDELVWDAKKQAFLLSIGDNPMYGDLTDRNEQSAILSDALKVKDFETASSFLSLYGPLDYPLTKTDPSKVVKYELFILAVERLQLGVSLLKAIRNDINDLFDYLFFYAKATDFNGDAAEIRKSRKRLKQSTGWSWRKSNSEELSLVDSAGNVYVSAFAPVSPFTESFNYVQIVNRQFEVMPWYRTASGKMSSMPSSGTADFKDATWLAHTAALQVARLANEAEEAHANVRPIERSDSSIGFESSSIVPDIWSAAILAFRSIVLESSRFAYCPHPNCNEMFEVTKTNKKSCGRAACRKYVQRAEV